MNGGQRHFMGAQPTQPPIVATAQPTSIPPQINRFPQQNFPNANQFPAPSAVPQVSQEQLLMVY